MRGLKDRHVVVTGGGSGIGRAICRRFGEEGCLVSIFDLAQDTASQTAAQIEAAGGRAKAYRVDITDRQAVAAAVEEAISMAPIDVLVNNAGWDQAVAFVDTQKDLWDKVIAINLYGPLNLHHAVLPGMVERGGGSIVNISSDAGRVGSSGEAVYAACKGGLIAFSKTIAREHARSNIRVNVVCPGPTETPLLASIATGDAGLRLTEGLKKAIPLRRLASPEDYPGIVCLLASDDASYITGQVISVSGGLTMAG